MKKLKNISVLILILSLLLCLFSACGKNLLESPTELTVNDEYRLSWSPIKNARSYTLKVISANEESKEYSSRRAYYSLANLDEGDYEINVKAVSGTNEYGDSEWSETFEFHKDYESGCAYTLINNNKEYEVTKIVSASGDIDLGDTYRGKPVTSIAASAFKGSGRVESIIIGKYVKSIGENAFYNCTKLREIVIPESVTSIGTSAFHNCNKLESIKLPSGITEIADYTFISCASLKSVELPNVTSIGEYAFTYCNSLTEISIPDSVKSIGEYAFASCTGLNKVSIGSGLESISQFTFHGCKALTQVSFGENSSLNSIEASSFASCSALESITIPEGVSDIGDRSFYDCTDLAEVDLPESLEHVGMLAFNGTKLYTSSIEKSPFVYADNWLVAWTGQQDADVKANLTKLDEKVLQNGVVGIADSVFYNSALISVDLPDSVRAIGRYAFAYSANLGRVYTYEDNYTQTSNLALIDEYAFRGCSLLNRLFLNEGLKQIKRGAFYDCTSLVNNSTTGVSLIPSTVESIGTDAFKKTALYDQSEGVVYAGNWVVGYNGSNSTTVILSGLEGLNVRGISDYAFYNCSELKSISLAASSANSVRYIGRGAFYGCTNLSAVSFSRVLEKIEDFAFYKCSSLFKISFPSRLKSIGYAAFYKCTNLDEVDLSDTQVTDIGEYAFYNCINIKKISLGEKVEKIGQRAFYKNISVEELNLPDSLNTIGERAFYKCEGLKKLSLGNGLEVIGENAFNGCASLTNLTIPDSVTDIGNYAFYKCVGLTSIEFGNGVKNIGNYAFANIPLITKLNLPQSVENIGRYAFMRCAALTSVTLNSDIQSIGIHAFYGCSNLTIFTNATELAAEWSDKFNSSFRPVIWGCELSEDGSYVVSLTITASTISNSKASNGINNPVREGYEFIGWSTESGATEAQFKSDELIGLDEGTKVYAVWQQVSV